MGNKHKKYLQTNMARARIEKQYFDLQTETDEMSLKMLESRDVTICNTSDHNLTSQEFSTAATNQIVKPGNLGLKRTLSKCESYENICSNLMPQGVLDELDRLNDYLGKSKLKKTSAYSNNNSKERDEVAKTSSSVFKPLKTSKKSSIYDEKVKSKVGGRRATQQIEVESMTQDSCTIARVSKRSSFITSSEDSPMKFLQSSLKRWRVIPRTNKKISFAKVNSRTTKPKPFALSKSNYSKQKVPKQVKKFKARKVPDMAMPFIVFKNDQKLTTFKEFGLTTKRREEFDRTFMQRQPSQNHLMANLVERESKMWRTPQNKDYRGFEDKKFDFKILDELKVDTFEFDD